MSDKYFSSVHLLLGLNGPDGATSTTDESPSPKTVTFNGNAHLSTAEKKYGASALLLDGNGDYLTLASSTIWGFHKNATVELWAYRASHSRLEYIISNRNSVILNNSWVLEWQTNGAPSFVCWNNSGTQSVYYSGITVPTSTWAHIAFVREGNEGRLYVNGELSYAATSIWPSSVSRLLYIGRDPATTPTRDLTGMVDEVRFTDAVRYTGSRFTPPQGPYSRAKRVGNAARKVQTPVAIFR